MPQNDTTDQDGSGQQNAGENNGCGGQNGENNLESSSLDLINLTASTQMNLVDHEYL